jgi:hypothetical protein
MAKSDKGNLVKVIANYSVREDTATLWGVDFVKQGEGDDAKYVAEVDSETSKSLIEAGRATTA